MGIILPGKPIANVCFKVYGYISMTQAISFLSDFKLGHYMKIPPRSMFLVQVRPQNAAVSPSPSPPTRGTVISRPPAASVYRDDRSGDDKPGSRVVAAGIGGEHLPGGSAAAQQPVDVPERSSILRRVRHLGARRAAAHLRPAGQLRRTQLVLPGRRPRARRRVAVPQEIPPPELDPTHQSARPAGRHGLHAPRHAAELHLLDRRRHLLQLLRLPLPQEMVAEIQLCALRRTRRRRCLHGRAPILRRRVGERQPRLVGHRRRALRARQVPHRQGCSSRWVPRLLSHLCSKSTNPVFRTFICLGTFICLQIDVTILGTENSDKNPRSRRTQRGCLFSAPRSRTRIQEAAEPSADAYFRLRPTQPIGVGFIKILAPGKCQTRTAKHPAAGASRQGIKIFHLFVLPRPRLRGNG